MVKTHLRQATCGFLLLLLTCTSPLAEEATIAEKPLIFGFLPVVSAERLVSRFSPLVDYLSEELGREVRIETAPGFKSFIDRTHHEHRYDILFTAPHTFYLAYREAGYRALVRVDQPGMRAAIITRKNSGIGSLQDMPGKKLSTVDPLALATVLAINKLKEAGINPGAEITLVHTPSNDASLMSMLHGNTDAAVAMMPVYLRLDPAIIAQTHVIAQSELMPHIPISVAPWVSESLATKIQDILLDMNNTERGREVLSRINWPGFIKTSSEQYRELEWVLREME